MHALGEKLEYQLEYLNKIREPGRVLRRLKKSALTLSHASLKTLSIGGFSSLCGS